MKSSYSYSTAKRIDYDNDNDNDPELSSPRAESELRPYEGWCPS